MQPSPIADTLDAPYPSGRCSIPLSPSSEVRERVSAYSNSASQIKATSPARSTSGEGSRSTRVFRERE
jgi:hypothetical protein